jgi:type I site-specific restriction endonuclease
VIATTSQLMSTGVDAQTCHLIVLDKRINSMTEFKQTPIDSRAGESRATRDLTSASGAVRSLSDPIWRSRR